MKLSFFINLKSGDGRGQEIADQLLQFEREGRLQPCIKYSSTTPSQEDLLELLQNDRIIIIGGDGTLSRFVAEVINSNHVDLINRPPFGFCVIPIGTGNDLARELGVLDLYRILPLFEVLKSFKEAKTVPFDVFQLIRGNHVRKPELFLNYLSIGFDGEVVQAFDKNRYNPGFLKSLGKLGNRARYAVESLKRSNYSLNLENIKIIGDSISQTIPSRCKSIWISNIRAVMGIGLINKIGNISDGKIECTITKSTFDYVKMIVSNFSQLAAASPIGSFENIRIEGLDPNLSFQLDGEASGKIASAWCQIKRYSSVPFCIGL